MVLLCLSSLVLLFWVACACDRWRWWPSRHQLPLAPSGPTGNGTDTLVAIPARDEADVVEECLSTLIAQSDDFAQLVFVDDRSEDGTGAIARGLAQASVASTSIDVLEGKKPTSGWSGKLHALNLALDHAFSGPRGDTLRWILLTDADIRHPPGSIRALRAMAEAGPYDLVSVMVRLSTDAFWEKLLIVPFVYFFQLLYPFRNVSRPKSKCAAAAGGCVLISRRLLEALGGLEAIRDAVIDDVTLARRAADHGGRLWLGLCPTMVSTRKYRRLGEIVRMVARTAFTQLGYSYALLGLCLVALAVFLVSPPLLCLAASVRAEWAAAIVAASAWGIQSATLYPAVRFYGVPRYFALTLPLASAFYMWMTFLSAWNHFRGMGAMWKGRKVGE